jgi:hypothetical protein
MYIKEYKVRYAKTGEIFTKPFTQYHYQFIDLYGGVSVVRALELVNKWNQQNAMSGFTYWIE